MRATLACVLLLLTCAAGSLQAQNDCLKHLSWPAVGRWASYSSVGSGRTMTLRYAAVGTEKREGVPLKWIEMQTRVDSAPGNVFQMLLPGRS
jgi:hypothetical protein